MKTLLLVIFLPIFLHAAEFPYNRAEGTYVYKGNFAVTKLIQTEVVQEASNGGKARLSELRGQGFQCSRRSPESWLCRKNEVPQAWPDLIEQTLSKKLGSFYIAFFGGGTPKLIIDTFTTQEWIIDEQIDVNGIMLSKYGYNFYYETQIKRILFPVSEDQPIPYARIHDDGKLSLNFLINTKEQKMNLGYLVDVFLIRK